MKYPLAKFSNQSKWFIGILQLTYEIKKQIDETTYTSIINYFIFYINQL